MNQLKKKKKQPKHIQITLPLVGFGDYYYSLEDAKKSEFKAKTMRELKVIERTFYNWVNGSNSPTQQKRLDIMKLHKQNFAYSDSSIQKISFKNESTSNVG